VQDLGLFLEKKAYKSCLNFAYGLNFCTIF
jgi:hypothetical protein